MMKPQACHVCGEYYRNMGRHMLSHSAAAVPCKICGESFKNMGRHMTMHQNERSVQRCRVCGENVKDMGQHLTIHRNQYLVSCDSCVQGFLSGDLLESHLLAHSLIPCSACDTNLHSMTDYHQHLREHHHECSECHDCNECVVGFRDVEDLESHLTSVADESGSRREECQNSGANTDEHQEDNVDHISKPAGKFQCIFCPRSFRLRSSLSNHYAHHQKDGLYGCIYCKRGFFNRFEALQHKQRMHRVYRFNCHLCRKKFSEGKFLNRHLRMKHNYRILMLESRLATLSRLRLETQTMEYKNQPEPTTNSHTSLIPDDSDRENFNIAERGESHEQSTTVSAGDRGFKYTLCPKTFAFRSGMSEHLSRRHKVPGAGRFKCQFCPRKFNKLTILRRHLKWHTEGISTDRYSSIGVRQNTQLEEGDLTGGPSQPLTPTKNDNVPLTEEHPNGLLTDAMLSDLQKPRSKFARKAKAVCSICGRRFFKLNLYQKHMEMHQWQNNNHSNAMFNDLQKPRSKHARKATAVCSICGRRFFKLNLYQKHMEMHQWQNNMSNRVAAASEQQANNNHTDIPVKCNKCDEEFVQISAYLHHLKVYHTPNTCPICSCVFNRYDSYLYHLRDHNLVDLSIIRSCLIAKGQQGLSGRGRKAKYACTLCEKRFYKIECFILHVKDHEGVIAANNGGVRAEEENRDIQNNGIGTLIDYHTGGIPGVTKTQGNSDCGHTYDGASNGEGMPDQNELVSVKKEVVEEDNIHDALMKAFQYLAGDVSPETGRENVPCPSRPIKKDLDEDFGHDRREANSETLSMAIGKAYRQRRNDRGSEETVAYGDHEREHWQSDEADEGDDSVFDNDEQDHCPPYTRDQNTGNDDTNVDENESAEACGDDDGVDEDNNVDSTNDTNVQNHNSPNSKDQNTGDDDMNVDENESAEACGDDDGVDEDNNVDSTIDTNVQSHHIPNNKDQNNGNDDMNVDENEPAEACGDDDGIDDNFVDSTFNTNERIHHSPNNRDQMSGDEEVNPDENKTAAMKLAMLKAYQDLYGEGPAETTPAHDSSGTALDNGGKENDHPADENPSEADPSKERRTIDNALLMAYQDLDKGMPVPTEPGVHNKKLIPEKIQDKCVVIETDGKPTRGASRWRGFPCTFCTMRFRSIKLLRRHSKVHKRRSASLLKKSEGPRTLSPNRPMDKYEKSHLEIKEIQISPAKYSCHVCRRQFNEKEVLERHMIVHQGNMFDIGTYISISQPNQPQPSQHVSSQPAQAAASDPCVCRYCRKSYSTKGSRERHEKTCPDGPGDQKILTSTIGSSSVHSSDEMSSKIQPEQTATNDPCVCRYCRKSYATKGSRERHEKTCPDGPGEGKILTSTIGSSSVHSSDEMSSKIQPELTATSDPCVCRYCRKSYSTKGSRERHEKTCPDGPGEGQILTSTIGSSSVHSSDEMSSKIQPEQTAMSDPCVCRYCRKRYSNKANRERHENTCSEGPGEGKISTSPIVVCRYCGKCYSNKANRERHEKTCSDGTSAKAFDEQPEKPRGQAEDMSLKEKEVHSSSSTDDIPTSKKDFTSSSKESFPSTTCEQSFNSDKELESHMVAAHKEKPVGKCVCFICGSTFKSREHLKNHEEKHVPRGLQRSYSEPLFSCGVCGQRVRFLSHMKRHIEGHRSFEWGTEAYIKISCSQCSENFLSVTKLEDHLKTHQDNDISCSVCGKTFTLKCHLFRHMACKHNQTQIHNRKLSFSKRSHIDFNNTNETHKGNEHQSSDNDFSCSFCGKHFEYKRNLDQHEAMHKVTEKFSNKQFPCTHCDRIFRYKMNQIKHTKTCQTQGKPLRKDHNPQNKCSVCGKTFTLKCHLFRHMACQHNPTQTSVYRRKLSSPKKRHIHFNKRLNTRPLKGNTLKRALHFRTKQYECLHCNRVFYKRRLYNLHMKKHNKSKPSVVADKTTTQRPCASASNHTIPPEHKDTFVCHLCNQQFTKSGHLSKHLRQVHCEDDSEEENPQNESEPTPVTDIPDQVSPENPKFQCGYFCGVCDARFYNINDLKKHLMDHQEGRIETNVIESPQASETIPKVKNPRCRYECHMCERKFFKLKHLHKHEKTHQRGAVASSSSDQVQVVDVETGQEESINHTRKSSDGKIFRRSYDCRICDRKFYKLRTLHQHEKTHQVKRSSGTGSELSLTPRDNSPNFKVRRRTFECHLCSRKFYKLKNLRLHVKMHRETEGGCKKKVTKRRHPKGASLGNNDPTPRSSLSRHRRCVICGQVFSDSNLLVYHLKLHEGEQKAKLENLKKSSASTEAVPTQKQPNAISIDQDFFACNLCENIYTSSVKLKRHLAEHNATPHPGSDVGPTP